MDKEVIQKHLEGHIPQDMIDRFIQNEKLRNALVQEEKRTGRALVDVQNWLSEDGKKQTQIINKFLNEMLTNYDIEIIL